MAKCITDVMARRINANAVPSSEDGALMNSFTEAVNEVSLSIADVTGKLNQTNCTQVVLDWCAENMGLNVYAATEMLANIQKALNFKRDFNPTLQLPDLNFSDKFCSMLSTWIAWIQGIIDIATKAVFALFVKIEAARMQLEVTLKGFVNAAYKCIMKILKDLTVNLNLNANVDVSANLSFDWKELYQLMIDCPCFCRALAYVTGCTRDNANNDISRNPTAVIECIKNKMPGISFKMDGAIGFSDSMKNAFFEGVFNLFANIQKAIEFTFAAVMQPLRALIKAYADLLTQKFDVTAFIKGLGNFECFFVYTTEYKHNVQFYGMSIIDMINTFKGWTKCFTHLCPTLARDIEAKIKDINESLRLNGTFWTSAFEADLFAMCIAAKLGYISFSDVEMREIYRDNPKNTFDSILSQLQSINIKKHYTEYKRSSKAGEVANRSKVQEAIMFRTAPDRENEVNVGEKPITEENQKKCVKMAHNLVDKTVSPYFTEKFYQLLRLLGDYEMNSRTVTELTEILDNCSKKKYPINFNQKFTPFKSNSTERTAFDEYPDEIKVTYYLQDDYNEAEITKILGAYA